MLLDIGIGIIAAVFISRPSGIALTAIFLAGGVIFSLLPDLDFMAIYGKRDGTSAHEHRDLLHYPLLFVPIGTIAIYLFADWHWALLFAITTLSHFIHDSVGVGWGVRWFYPISKKYYAFFYHYDISRNKLPYKWFYAWNKNEVRELSKKYGDPHWIKNIYLKFHPYAIVEFLVFVISLLVLYIFH